jgi:hypothetical protein
MLVDIALDLNWLLQVSQSSGPLRETLLSVDDVAISSTGQSYRSFDSIACTGFWRLNLMDNWLPGS